MSAPGASIQRVALLIAVSACGPAGDSNGAATTESSGAVESTGPHATTSADDDVVGSSSTTDIDAVEGSGSTTALGATEDGSTGAESCDPVVPGEFNPCWDAAARQTHTRDCNWMGTSDSVGFPGCLVSAYVPDASVCIMMGCRDSCDCFAPPTTGNARVECLEGIIADDTACVLYCADGQTCPDGMVCGVDVCVWEDG